MISFHQMFIEILDILLYVQRYYVLRIKSMEFNLLKNSQHRDKEFMGFSRIDDMSVMDVGKSIIFPKPYSSSIA